LNNKNQAPNIEEQRDLELENIVGNLMIAQYQVDKLRSRLSECIHGYSSTRNKKASVNVFKHNERWYKVSTKVEEVTSKDPLF
jgi:RecG-like helicase